MPNALPSTSATTSPATTATSTRYAFKELTAVEDADAIKKHHEAGQADRPRDRSLRREGADEQPDEQHRADAERKSAEIDLADEIADADREEDGQNRLRADNVLRKCNHSNNPPIRVKAMSVKNNSAGVTTRGAKLLDHAVDKIGCRRRRIGVFVFEAQRLPFEGTELVKRLHLDPFHVLHRGDKLRDLLDIRWIIGEARNEGEPYPRRFADRRQPFGKAQRRGQVTAGGLAIGFGIAALDVEHHEIEV
jgi:hypothetical protein